MILKVVDDGEMIEQMDTTWQPKKGDIIKIKDEFYMVAYIQMEIGLIENYLSGHGIFMTVELDKIEEKSIKKR